MVTWIPRQTWPCAQLGHLVVTLFNHRGSMTVIEICGEIGELDKGC